MTRDEERTSEKEKERERERAEKVPSHGSGGSQSIAEQQLEA